MRKTGAAVLLVHSVSPWCCAAECTLATLASTCLEGNGYKNFEGISVELMLGNLLDS